MDYYTLITRVVMYRNKLCIIDQEIFGANKLMSKLTLTCGEHVCVLKFLLSDTVTTRMWHEMGCMWVNFCVLHVSYILCSAHK